MVFSKDELIGALRHEVKILLHLAGKVDRAQLDYRPTAKQRSTLELMHTFEKVGLPDGVLNVVTGFGNEIGEPLVADPLVARITFTGSGAVGKRIAAQAGTLLKRVTLELGGKSAQVVFADAQLEQAVRGIVAGIFVSNGQSCVAGSRLLVQDELHDAFVDGLLGAIAGLRPGDPRDPATQFGPIANAPQFERVCREVRLQNTTTGRIDDLLTHLGRNDAHVPPR